MTSSSSLDVYINHQSGNLVGNEPSSRAEACSLPQIRPLNTPMRCSSAENSIGKNANLSADLSEKGNNVYPIVFIISSQVIRLSLCC